VRNLVVAPLKPSLRELVEIYVLNLFTQGLLLALPQLVLIVEGKGVSVPSALRPVFALGQLQLQVLLQVTDRLVRRRHLHMLLGLLVSLVHHSQVFLQLQDLVLELPLLLVFAFGVCAL